MKVCASCSGQSPDDSKFCQNCGAALQTLGVEQSRQASENSSSELHSNVQGPSSNQTSPTLNLTKFCQACGSGLVDTAVVCPACGSAVQSSFNRTSASGKNKTTAVLLAVFLSGWTWLYLYKKCAKKFWIYIGTGFALLVAYIVSAVIIGRTDTGWAYENSQYVYRNGSPWFALDFLFAFLGYLGLYIWAIVDVATKKSEWYQSFE